MKSQTCALLLFFTCLTAVPVLRAAEAADKPDPRAEIARRIPGAKPDDLRPSPIPGVYELQRGADIAYVSADGKYVIAGDLYELDTEENLTEKRRRAARRKLIATVPESQMVIFGPKDAQHTITVFTDIDCSYCRRLHSQIAEYNRLGIRVRYLFYPRFGPGSESWKKAERVWCAPDRNQALTRAKRGETIDSKPCGKTPVERHYELGQDFDVQGTPAILLGDGDFVQGYVPPETLAEHLRKR